MYEFQKVHVERETPKIEEKAPPKIEEKAPPKIDGVVTYGPWGGHGGSIFDDGTYTGIRQINLSRNVGIVWIRVLYDQDGEGIWGSKQGGTGGFIKEKVKWVFAKHC